MKQDDVDDDDDEDDDDDDDDDEESENELILWHFGTMHARPKERHTRIDECPSGVGESFVGRSSRPRSN